MMKLQWLGQPSYETCFAQDPNFDGCWRNSFRQAQLECDQTTQGYPNYNACVEGRARRIANQVCIPACEAYLRGADEYPWGVRNNNTCELQRDLNTALVAEGYNPITVDCVLGPATCGASDALGRGVPAGCVGRPRTPPTRGPQGRPPPAPVAKKSRAGLLAAGAALLIGGLVIYAQGG